MEELHRATDTLRKESPYTGFGKALREWAELALGAFMGLVTVQAQHADRLDVLERKVGELEGRLSQIEDSPAPGE